MFKVEFIEASPQVLTLKFAAQKEFLANDATTHLHSGFCTMILDSVMGGAVMGSLDQMQPIATINLTTQHSVRPVLDELLLCSGTVERIEHHVAVVRGQVTSFDSGEIYASALGSFMIGTRAIPLQNGNGARQ